MLSTRGIRIHAVLMHSDDDDIYGMGGADVLFGDAGSDFIEGDGGVSSGMGKTTPPSEHGADIIVGGAGRDVLLGQGGNDELFGGTEDDQLWGDDPDLTDTPLSIHGNDYLDGGDGNDRLEGGGRDDELFGGAGKDTLWGDNGSDSTVSSGFEGNDYLDGKSGDDKDGQSKLSHTSGWTMTLTDHSTVDLSADFCATGLGITLKDAPIVPTTYDVNFIKKLTGGTCDLINGNASWGLPLTDSQAETLFGRTLEAKRVEVKDRLRKSSSCAEGDVLYNASLNAWEKARTFKWRIAA